MPEILVIRLVPPELGDDVAQSGGVVRAEEGVRYDGRGRGFVMRGGGRGDGRGGGEGWCEKTGGGEEGGVRELRGGQADGHCVRCGD